MILLLSAALVGTAQAVDSQATGGCPYLMQERAGPPMRPLEGQQNTQQVEEFLEAMAKIDFKAVKADLAKAMLESQDYWPADYNNYGPFWVRMAWHCSGSYRRGDGRGGCDGGHQVYDPERSWDDNVNLDKARRTVAPIKAKYGKGLSWGDLIILAGDVAVEQMGGPILGTCLGRIDDIDGRQAFPLGFNQRPTVVPCEKQGFCKAPAGSIQTGLIYVNPEGPGGEPDPVASARSVRDTFTRMGMNDTETVALVGGGHAFGKFHGACDTGPGQRPSENQTHPWIGTCGEPGSPLFGKSINTVSSGFEGPWTEDPTRFSNNYFKYLVQNKFEKYTGPGGHIQWRAVSGPKIPPAPSVDLKGTQEISMLTADIAFTADPENKYQDILQRLYEDRAFLDEQWSHAWYKLTTRDMGPVTRCLGDFTAPAQPFQNPLPATPTEAEYKKGMGANIMKIVQWVDKLIMNPVSIAPKAMGLLAANGRPNAGAALIRYAFACASSFRQTDYQGGCNGARIRLSPEKDFAVNHGLSTAYQLLMPIKEHFGDQLSWADLIVLAGTRAIQNAGGDPMTFCGGRTDAPADEVLDMGSRKQLELRITGMESDTAEDLLYQAELMGLTPEDIVAIIGAARTLDAQILSVQGFIHKTTKNGLKLDNEFFKVLLENDWDPITIPIKNVVQYANRCAVKGTKPCKGLYKITKTDWLLKVDNVMGPITIAFAGDDAMFKRQLAKAWTKLMNADRFDGPGRNLCNTRKDLVIGFDEVVASNPTPQPTTLGQLFESFYRSEDHASRKTTGARDEEYDSFYDKPYWGGRQTELASEPNSLIQGANTMAMIAGYVGLAAAAVAFASGRFGGAKEPTLESYVSEETPLRQ